MRQFLRLLLQQVVFHGIKGILRVLQHQNVCLLANIYEENMEKFTPVLDISGQTRTMKEKQYY
jgi:hypothetical protein